MNDSNGRGVLVGRHPELLGDGFVIDLGVDLANLGQGHGGHGDGVEAKDDLVLVDLGGENLSGRGDLRSLERTQIMRAKPELKSE